MNQLVVTDRRSINVENALKQASFRSIFELFSAIAETICDRVHPLTLTRRPELRNDSSASVFRVHLQRTITFVLKAHAPTRQPKVLFSFRGVNNCCNAPMPPVPPD